MDRPQHPSSEATPIEVHGTRAWVLLTRDYPLASMHMSYAEAERLHEDLGRVLSAPHGWPEGD